VTAVPVMVLSKVVTTMVATGPHKVGGFTGKAPAPFDVLHQAHVVWAFSIVALPPTHFGIA